MKSAVLIFLLAPASAFAGTVARFGGLPGAVVAPIQLQAPVMNGAPSLMSLTAPALSPSLSLSAPTLAAPAAPAVAAPVVAKALVPAALNAAAPAAALPQALARARAMAAAATHDGPNASGPARTPNDRSDGSRMFDGAGNNQTGAQLVDPNFGPYRRLYGSEQDKLNATLRYGANGSPVFAALNGEFQNQGGYYLLDGDPNAKYMAAAAVDQNRRPVIVLTYDLLNRYNGRSEDVYRGAPWEFIASVIAREQVFYNAWYAAIPASAEKLAVSFMNMTRVFVDLTNGTSRSWATDKDYQAVSGDRSTYTQWNWFETLVAASRAAAQGVGTNAGHLIDSKFFSWVRDWTAPQDKASVPAFQYSLWEQYDGKYYRPGDAKNGQPLPPGAPRIDKATYDRAAQTAYGSDGKGSAQNGGLDSQSAYGWIIQWLKDRFEI
ncbi:MAG: hypothetical protein PHS14_17620 [Elusimicrobia bacterium]|nr:hypothetical protein [Elusimicrobiota bacterium]